MNRRFVFKFIFMGLICFWITGCGGNSTASNFNISGQVTSNGTGLSGVTVARMGNGSTTATTDSNGNYYFNSVVDGNYTISVAIAGSSHPVTVAGANVSDVNFTVTLSAEPAPLNNFVILSQQNITIGTGSTNYLIQAAGTTNVSDGSGSNTIDFSTNQIADVIQIYGGSNIIIFRPGTTVGSLTVGGGSNTIYFPKGTSIVFATPPPISTTVLAY